jgi:DNA-binding NtrC family response regulator
MKSTLSIMIADADRTARCIIAEQITLAYPQAIISSAETGTSLIEAIRLNRFDLIFLDMILPYTEIPQLKEAIGSFLKGTTTKLVLLSETLRPHWMTIALTLNAHEVLLKPCKPNAIYKLIETYQQASLERNALVVDGSARLRGLLRSAIAASEFQIAISEADSGRRALQIARGQNFHVLFIYKSLTDNSAHEVGCQIMTISCNETAVVIMDLTENAIRRSNDILGVKDILRIPFDKIEVNRALYGAFGLWRPYLMNSIIRLRDLKKKNTDTNLSVERY